jgi:Skp family chaperone for outer membrane proteins
MMLSPANMALRSENDMSGHTDHIKRIEEKAVILTSRLKNQTKENSKLRKELDALKKENEELKKQQEQHLLQLALSKQAGIEQNVSADNSKLVKKINEYIREIDRCIALLDEKD